MANLTVYRGMKLTKDLAQKLEAAAREKGFSSPSAFIRAALGNELTSRKPIFDESEQRIVETRASEPFIQVLGNEGVVVLVRVGAIDPVDLLGGPVGQ